MSRYTSRPSPLRDQVLKLLANGPITNAAIAKACSSNTNCIGVSLNLWRKAGLVKLAEGSGARPLLYELTDAGRKLVPQSHASTSAVIDPTKARKPTAASQIVITKPDPRVEDKPAKKAGAPETVEEWTARTGNKPEQLPGPVQAVYLTVPAFPRTT